MSGKVYVVVYREKIDHSFPKVLMPSLRYINNDNDPVERHALFRRFCKTENANDAKRCRCDEEERVT